MDNEYKRLARTFRSTVPSRVREVDRRETTHTVSMKYPPDKETLEKIKYLGRYKSFIHEARVSSQEGSSCSDIYEYLIPAGCKVQFLQVEYAHDTENSTVNVDKLYQNVSSVHIKMETIREDDIFRAISAVKDNEDFGIRISGWHEFDDKYITLAHEAIGDCKDDTKDTIFQYEIGKNYLVFWSEEKY